MTNRSSDKMSISSNQSLQSYMNDWVQKFLKNWSYIIKSLFQNKNSFNEDYPNVILSNSEILSLVDCEELYTFENHFKSITNREGLENIVYNIAKVQITQIMPILWNFNQDISQANICKFFAEFVINHFLHNINKFREEYIKSCLNSREAFNNLLQILKSLESTAGCDFLIKFYMRKLYFSASLADKELEMKKEKPNQIDEVGRILMSFFSTFQMSDEKEIVFFCIICLIRIHFKLRTYRNSKTLVNWVEKSGIDFDNIPKSEVVTYLYYSGRLAMYEIRLIEAREILLRAYNLCQVNHIPNRKLLIEYLIPLNMFSGILPRHNVLTTYGLEDYLPLVESFRKGDILKFESAIESLENRFISLGTFLIIEKLKTYVLRNCIKLIAKCFEDSLSLMNNPVIKLEMIQEVMRDCYNNEISLDELELYIIGAIYKGLIAGYVHNNNKVLILSKKNPFPNLADNFNKNYSKII
jgi:hypothetical protein